MDKILYRVKMFDGILVRHTLEYLRTDRNPYKTAHIYSIKGTNRTLRVSEEDVLRVVQGAVLYSLVDYKSALSVLHRYYKEKERELYKRLQDTKKGIQSIEIEMDIFGIPHTEEG